MINPSCCAEDPELLAHQLQVGLLVPALVPSSRVVLGLADPCPLALVPAAPSSA